MRHNYEFIETKKLDFGYIKGYCKNCFADMAKFDGKTAHYKSHTTAISLKLWGSQAAAGD